MGNVVGKIYGTNSFRCEAYIKHQIYCHGSIYFPHCLMPKFIVLEEISPHTNLLLLLPFHTKAFIWKCSELNSGSANCWCAVTIGFGQNNVHLLSVQKSVP